MLYYIRGKNTHQIRCFCTIVPMPWGGAVDLQCMDRWMERTSSSQIYWEFECCEAWGVLAQQCSPSGSGNACVHPPPASFQSLFPWCRCRFLSWIHVDHNVNPVDSCVLLPLMQHCWGLVIEVIHIKVDFISKSVFKTFHLPCIDSVNIHVISEICSQHFRCGRCGPSKGRKSHNSKSSAMSWCFRRSFLMVHTRQNQGCWNLETCVPDY